MKTLKIISIKSYGIAVNINLPKKFEEDSNIKYGVIYKITNKINNKIYIGQSNNYIVRFRHHIKSYVKNEQYPLYRSMNKHGINNFEFSIIDFCDSIDHANSLENYYISYYKSNNSLYGYNIAAGGNVEKQSEDWINKRIATAGSDEAKKYGKIKTELDKKILSENSPKFWQGKTRDEETKLKISQTKKSQNLIPPNVKKVLKLDVITKIETIYESTTEAARKNEGISQATISRKCNGLSKNRGDIYWSFI